MLLSFPRRRWFDRPFERLTVLSEVEGLTVLSKVEGLTTLSKIEGESRGLLLAVLDARLRGHDGQTSPMLE